LGKIAACAIGHPSARRFGRGENHVHARHPARTRSPTYAIVESYPLEAFTLHHFDLYRFASPEEWEDAGLDDLFSPDSVCIIEWPQQGGAFTPPADITVSLNHAAQGRTCTATAHTANGQKSLEAWLNSN